VCHPLVSNAMKNITLSADASLIEAARDRANRDHTTLNEQFRRWLADYAHPRERILRYEQAMAHLRGKLEVGRKLSREEMNER
jgi:hypothetical protein